MPVGAFRCEVMLAFTVVAVVVVAGGGTVVVVAIDPLAAEGARVPAVFPGFFVGLPVHEPMIATTTQNPTPVTASRRLVRIALRIRIGTLTPRARLS